MSSHDDPEDGADTEERCLRAYLARDYADCARRALDLIEAEIPARPDLYLQLLAISLERAGKLAQLRTTAPHLLAATRSVPWAHELMKITLQQIEPLDVWEKAVGEDQLCQAAYYTAARLLSDGDTERARGMFEMCTRTHASAIERRLAEAELSLLPAAPPGAGAPAPEPDDDDDSPDDAAAVVARANGVVGQLYEDGRFAEGLELAREVAALAQHDLPALHPALATSLHQLGVLLATVGEPDAEQLVTEALRIRREALGPDHEAVGSSLTVRAQMAQARGDLAAAAADFGEALRVLRVSLGTRHPRYAATLGDLAVLHEEMGRYAVAEGMLREAMEIQADTIGTDSPRYAQSLDDLAAVRIAAGDYAGAEPLCRRALEIRRARLAGDAPDLASSLTRLADLYRIIGDVARAVELYREATAITRRAFGDRHRDVAVVLGGMAAMFHGTDRFAEAEPLLRESLAICRALPDASPLDRAAAAGNLAVFCQVHGDSDEAGRLHREAIELTVGALGAGHPRHAGLLSNLAEWHRTRGELEEAEACHRRALDIRRRTLGDEHPDVASSLGNTAVACEARGRPEEALALMREAAAIDQRLMRQVFSIASERQRLDFLTQLRFRTMGFVSLVLRSFARVPEAIAATTELILARKGVAADVSSAVRQLALEGRYPALAGQLQEWYLLRGQIARSTLHGPGREGLDAHREQLRAWESRREQLEVEMAGTVPPQVLSTKRPDADVRSVIAALPADTAIVELFRLDVLEPAPRSARDEDRWGPPRYLAFVIRSGDDEGVELIDLGDAAPTDALVGALHRSIPSMPGTFVGRDSGGVDDPIEEDGARVAPALAAAVFEPLGPALRGRRRLWIAPDGALCGVPFAILPDGHGAALIDTFQLGYLTCARDVLRLGAPPARTPAAPIVIGAPDYDLAGEGSSPPSRSLPAVARAFRRFLPLREAREEATVVGALLDVTPWIGPDALEGRLKAECRSPRVLHIATHGYFLTAGDLRPDDSDSDARTPTPLLLGGLTLAGVNTALAGGPLAERAEDGLLTGEDVCALDLEGTELVVLSACETATGELRPGEGVLGLRRAFVIAGARTLVMSLWKVPDAATRELMVAFYRGLDAGLPRAEALRQAQLEVRKRHPSPRAWGAFICQGESSPLRRDA